MSSLELAEKVCNEEATKHQAHGEQGGVREGPLNFLVDGFVAFRMGLDMLLHDGMERVVHGFIQMFVVQDQRVALEDLR